MTSGESSGNNSEQRELAQPRLDDLERAIRLCFAQDTCSPDDLPEWSLQNPSRGHCAMATLTVHHYVGGQVVCAEVTRNGDRFGYHWWNQLDGVDVDFTRDQFAPDELVGEPWGVDLPAGEEHVYSAQHRVFLARVAKMLHGAL